MNSILYIFLPCKQIYPIGCTYLADYVHKRHPEIRQRILDLSQIAPGERSRAVNLATGALGLIVKLESMSVSRRISPTFQRLKRYLTRFNLSER